ncbi:MAG: hypothetical protein ACREC8_03760 [Limisphaerales bacterium]
MNFHATNVRWLVFLVGAAMVVVLPVRAQQGGEPIIFSSPDGGGVSSNLTQLSKPLDLPDSPSFAPSGFGADLPLGEAPPPVIPPAVSISEGQQLQNLLNPKKDWMFMTPGEIMGVESPEQILQVPERNAMGLRKNSSTLENFLGQQNGSRFGATNGFASGDQASAWHFSNDRDFQPDAETPNSVGGNLGSMPQTLNRFVNNAFLRNDSFAGQNADQSAGANLQQQFVGSSPPPKPISAQPTDMQRLQTLLGTSPAFQNETPAASFNSGGFISPSANNNFGQPIVTMNPVGASYAPLTSGIGTPTGLMPLPTITGQSSLQPAITPAWAPQTPPWMSQGPQPFVIPQRKF